MSTTRPTPYPDLNEVLRELVESQREVLGDSLVAACLQGSFAVGDFDEHSDVDWVVAVEEELTADQVDALQTLHGRVFDLECEWARHLEGSYFPKDVLRDHRRVGEKLWYLDNGSRSLVQALHCNTVVVRWTVREHGVPLAGPSTASLVDPIPVEALREDIRTALLGWGGRILADPEEINSRFYQAFVVHTYCRGLHDLRHGTVSSKRAGVEWAKTTVASDWAGLIDRSWSGRPDPARSSREPADLEELALTLEFLRYMMDEMERYDG